MTIIIRYVSFSVLLLLLCACGRHAERRWAHEAIATAETLMEQQPDSALHLLQSIEQPERLDKHSHMHYWLLLTRAKDKTDADITNELAIIQEVAAYFLGKRNFEKAALAAFCCARILVEQQEKQRALTAYLEAETIADKTGNSLLKGMIQHNIGVLYYDGLENYEEAISRLKKAIGYYQQITDSKREIAACEILGTCFLLTQQPDSALFYQKRALDVAMTIHDAISQSIILRSISASYHVSGNIAAAKEYGLQAIRIETPAAEQMRAFLNLADLYHTINSNDSLIYYAEKSIEAAELSGTETIQAPIYELLSRAEKKNGNFKKALHYQEIYVAQAIDFYKKRAQESLSGIQEKYQLEKIKNEHQTLLIHRLWIIVLSVTAIVVLLAVALLLYRRNIRHRGQLFAEKEKAENLLNERKRLRAERLERYLKTLLLEQKFKEGDKEKYTALFDKIKQIIFDVPKELVWEKLFAATDELFNSTLTQLQNKNILDDTEFKICSLACAGLDNTGIATVLKLQISTVKNRKVAIRKKLEIPPKGDIGEFLFNKISY